MKTVFLTSSPGFYKKTENEKIPTPLDNSEGFSTELKKVAPLSINFVYISSNPSDFEKIDIRKYFVLESLKLDGFKFNSIAILDYRFKEDIKTTILNADIVYLAGGHVPTQNKYFKEIKLKEILKDYNGVIIGHSAGSMNCAEEVYAQEEYPEELHDKNYKKLISGLGLTKIKVMPHINDAKQFIVDEGISSFDLSLKSCETITFYGIYDGGFIKICNNTATAFGKTLLFKNGTVTQLCNYNEKVDLPIC